MLFTLDAHTGAGSVASRLDGRRGGGLQSNADGSPKKAWVYNAVANTVSMVDFIAVEMVVSCTLELDDPADPREAGRAVFNRANASSTVLAW